MAGIKAPLEDILARLATLDVTNGDGNTVKLHSRVWNNQVEREKSGGSYVYPKPAAFVEIVSPIGWDEIGGNFLQSDLGISIHIVTELYNTEGTLDQNLVVYDLRDQIVALLSQYKPTGCGLMRLMDETPDYDADNVNHYILTFACNFIDSKASPYDPSRGNYIESEPPTGLQVNVTKEDTPIFTPVPQPYKIPQ
jgi:hypothetical protein